jgi:hypothetical protein
MDSMAGFESLGIPEGYICPEMTYCHATGHTLLRVHNPEADAPFHSLYLLKARGEKKYRPLVTLSDTESIDQCILCTEWKSAFFIKWSWNGGGMDYQSLLKMDFETERSQELLTKRDLAQANPFAEVAIARLLSVDPLAQTLYAVTGTREEGVTWVDYAISSVHLDSGRLERVERLATPFA